MIRILFTDSSQDDFIRLSKELEKELYLKDGDLADINYEVNKTGWMKDVVVLYDKNNAVACGALRPYDTASVEIKRMYVVPSYRRNKFASMILSALEEKARGEGFEYVILETGRNQPEAIAFYLRHQYLETERFGKYTDSSNSICFKKEISRKISNPVK
ncbi:MAG: GNAT family N-acetyltransferase [Citrobacter freundii]|nr:MAG: GNAT family N-acetyltransferase [Citrobacter freundii]